MIINSVDLLEPRTPFEYDAVYHKIAGIWPDDDYFLAKYNRIRAIIEAVIICGMFGFQFTPLMVVTNHDDAFETVIEGIGSLIVVSKVVPVICYRTNFIYLIRETEEINKYSSFTSKEATVHLDWQRFEDRLKKLLARCYILILVVLYCVAPIFKNELPLQGLLPEILKISPWFYITYVIQCLVISSNTICCISCDCFSITFMCQLCKHLELVRLSIKNLNYHDKVNLSSIINRHAITLNYGQMICDSLTSMYIFQHLCICMFLCFGGIIMLNVPNSLILTKIIVLSIILGLTLLLICYVGETIIVSSLNIANATESSNYESFLNDIPTIKAVSFILCRAQRPLRMPVGWVGSLNLKFFTETINKLLSAFMILRTVIK